MATKKAPEKRDATKREVVDPRIVKALGHPVRAQALAILNERVASPNEIAKELGKSVGHVSYHVKVLERCDCIELVSTAPRRGAVEHYYRATSRVFLSDEDWKRLPASIRPGMTTTLLKDIVSDAGTALEAGTFDERERHLSWTPLAVDERGWKEINDGLAQLLDTVLSVQLESAERLAASGEPGFSMSVSMMAYETPAGSRPDRSS